MRKRASKREFHAHAAGEVLDGFVSRQLEHVEIPFEQGAIPGGVAVAHELADVFDVHFLGKRAGVEDDAHALFDGDGLRRGHVRIDTLPEHFDRAGIGRDEVEDGLDGGRFAGAVGTDEPDDASGGYAQVDIL